MKLNAEQQKALQCLQSMFESDERTGRETPSQVRNAFPHLFSDPFPDTKMWARRFNAVRKKCGKRPVDLMDKETLAPKHTFTPTKRKMSAATVVDEESEEDEPPFEQTSSDIEPGFSTLQVSTVILDHAISYWEDPNSPQYFVSVVLFLPSGVPAKSVQVSVPSSKDRLCYSYERPLPARDGHRLCRRWTTDTAGVTKLEPYHPFVMGFHNYFKMFRARDDDPISSSGAVQFNEGITVEENIHENISLRFTAESTNSILVTMRQTNVDTYKYNKNQRDEVEA